METAIEARLFLWQIFKVGNQCAVARVQRQGSPTISVILPEDSQ